MKYAVVKFRSENLELAIIDEYDVISGSNVWRKTSFIRGSFSGYTKDSTFNFTYDTTGPFGNEVSIS